MAEATFVKHEACPACGSKDNLGRYDDGSGYCFGCEHFEAPTDGSNRRPAKSLPGSGKLVRGEYRALAKRNITKKTCEFFGYQVGQYQGKNVQIAPYYDPDTGQVQAQKLRTANKKFKIVGPNSKDLPLFGENKWRSGGKRLVITEGEIDCLSISQLNENKWPVVSVPNGAQGAAKAIARRLSFVDSYDAVVFAFDMDDKGSAAARECAALLTPGKAFIAEMPAGCKDANEALQANRGREVINRLWEAKPYRPEGIVDIGSVIEEALEDPEMGRSWPWESLTKATYGRRRGEIYGFGGGTGCGKSTVFKQITQHILHVEDVPVAMFMLEEANRVTAKTLAGMSMGKRVHVPGVQYDRTELESTLEDLNGRVYLYGAKAPRTWKALRDQIRYVVHGLGVRDIFLDHLTAVSIADERDERKAIDKMMQEIATLFVELDATLYFISHLTTPDGTPHEEGGRVMEKHFRGSRAIAFWSHGLFGIERDKQDVGGVTTFRVLKDRFTGDANGLTFGLRYDKETGRLYECALDSDEPDGSDFEDGDY